MCMWDGWMGWDDGSGTVRGLLAVVVYPEIELEVEFEL